MALLNPPETRLSMLVLIARYLARCRGQSDTIERLRDSVAPPSLRNAGKPDNLQHDIKVNQKAAAELGLITVTDGRVRLEETARKPAAGGTVAIANHVRSLVLADRMNQADWGWGSQRGARDLTNALSWFLTFDAHDAPGNMESGLRSAKQLQETDFGPRHDSVTTAIDGGDPSENATGWPISNATRWNAFQRWACSLGFAWRSPHGQLVPDPTPAISSVLPAIFAESDILPAGSFVEAVAERLPVLERGRYRRFVESNWSRTRSDVPRLSGPTTDALTRLAQKNLLRLEDRDDAPRIRMADDATFSHVKHRRYQS